MKLFGKNPVLERIKTNPQTIKKIILQEGHKDAAYLHRKAQASGIPVQTVPRTKMQKLARHINAQGVIIEITDFPYQSLADLLEWGAKKKAVMIFLDNIQDPQNFGAIVRSLACLGDFGVILPKHHSVQVTEAVLRIACGGENHVRIAQVSNLAQAVKSAKEAGYWITGTVVEGGQDIAEVSFPAPLGVIIGSEQKGIRAVLLKSVDIKVTIPMAKPRLSLNVAQATTIMAFEVMRQRRQRKKRRQAS